MFYDYLFVYGTLRKGFNLPLLQQIEKDIQWVGNSEIKGILYDIGEYPGAKPAENAESYITGDIFKLINPERILKILDEYEGYDPEDLLQSLYVRKKETVAVKNGEKMEAWVYWYNRPIEEKQRIHHLDYLKYIEKGTA